MKRVIALTLAVLLAVLCAGCSWMNGEYVSVTPHPVGQVQTSNDSGAVSDYAGLCTALTDLIDAGAAEGLIYLTDYPAEQIQADVEAAVRYAAGEYPIGAYAVEIIDYESGISGGQSALSVDITYRHTRSDVARIRTVRGTYGIKTAVADALADCKDSLVLQVTGYQDTDIVQIIEDYAAENPDLVMELPQTAVQVYPDQGTTRVVELVFSYQTSRDSLRQMRAKVAPIFSSAALYITSDADEQTKFSQLYSFLMERFDYEIGTSITPAYTLLCYGIGDSRAFAQVYAAMCRQADLSCVTVSGTYSGESRFWNIIQVNDAYYHVDLLRCSAEGAFRLRTDGEMAGYVWDYSAYPACGTAVPTEPEETAPAS